MLAAAKQPIALGLGDRRITVNEATRSPASRLWLDYLKRILIAKGELHDLIECDGLKGIASTPSIFEKAIGETDEWADALKQFPALGDHSMSEIYEHLAIDDIRATSDLLHPVYEKQSLKHR